MSQKKYWLINDVVSYFAPYHIYGKAGTEVIILHDHLDMMIVQDSSGNIFHSRTDNLTDKPPCNNLHPKKTEKSVEQPVKKSRTQKKVAIINQSNLFQ